MSTVLCTNGMLHQALAVVRSLGARGIRVITSEKTGWHASRFSKYTAKNLINPDPKSSPDLFMDWLVHTIRQERIDVLIPADDDSMGVVAANQDELKSMVRLAIPPWESYRIAADKGLTVQLATERGIPCPRTVQLPEWPLKKENDLFEAIRGLEFPVVIKPRKSSGSRGIRFVNTMDELMPVLSEINAVYPNSLIQERIPMGEIYDVCLGYNSRNELKASFVQKELRHFPIGRGPSTVQESVHRPDLVLLSEKLLQGIPWCGAADIEYMIDPRDGRPKLMEINPRLWTSLHLSQNCGIDFPWLLYQTAMELDPEPMFEYPAGRRGRSIVPGDLLHFISNPRRFRMDPPLWAAGIPDALLSRNDPMPAAGFMLSALRYGFSPDAWKFMIRR